MNSFLITFKPATESPERGWPLEYLQKLVKRHRLGERPVEKWRFHNRKDVSLGDRAFLLLQGKRGPAIIGYGTVAAEPKNKNENWRGIRFSELVDPANAVLVNKQRLLAIKGGSSVWRTQASGVQLAESIAADLEMLVVGKSSKPKSEGPDSNPDWTRDELILALQFYLNHRPNPPRKGSVEITELSSTLNLLGEKLFPPGERANTFRNANSVYMKLMNFRRLDPLYTSEGKTGLTRGAKAEEEVWAEFAADPVRCERVAAAIKATLDDPEIGAAWGEMDNNGIQEASEGRLLTRVHIARERNQKLVESKRAQVMRKNGKLACEVCDFDFGAVYGDRGTGFIECHHIEPVESFAQGHKTHLDDLALVCANCHRIVHRYRPWLSVETLKALLKCNAC